ncbi:MAG: hypothetical protein ABI702_04085 [Burkholderiales bacterium]
MAELLVVFLGGSTGLVLPGLYDEAGRCQDVVADAPLMSNVRVDVPDVICGERWIASTQSRSISTLAVKT